MLELRSLKHVQKLPTKGAGNLQAHGGDEGGATECLLYFICTFNVSNKSIVISSLFFQRLQQLIITSSKNVYLLGYFTGSLIVAGIIDP